MCEGKRDLAFLSHLRQLYCSGNTCSPKVDVKQARGKGGNNVVDTLLGTLRVKAYDVGVAFIETDVPPDTQRRDALRRKKSGILVPADPCLEAMLLRIANQPIPQTVQACKQAIELYAGNDLYQASDYAPIWSLALIQSARPNYPELETLINCFSSFATLD